MFTPSPGMAILPIVEDRMHQEFSASSFQSAFLYEIPIALFAVVPFAFKKKETIILGSFVSFETEV